MKKLFIFLLLPLVSFAPLEVFFDFEYTTIDGVKKQMNEFAGKKIVVVMLPVTQTRKDTLTLKVLEVLSKKFSSKYTIIGIPSIEDGYSDASKDFLIPWYRSIVHEQVIITEGMYTKKDSPVQDPLFRWLTHKDENLHFDEDVPGPRGMFFINEAGELYGVYSPAAALDEPLLNRMAL